MAISKADRTLVPLEDWETGPGGRNDAASFRGLRLHGRGCDEAQRDQRARARGRHTAGRRGRRARPVARSVEEDRLNIGCVAAHGHFVLDQAQAKYVFIKEGKPATAFLFKLISMLQFSGTVPMFDVNAYAEWLTK